MKVTIIVNSLSELKIVANHFGVDIKASEIVVSLPYPFEYDQETWPGYDEELPDELSFEDWQWQVGLDAYNETRKDDFEQRQP